MKLNHISSSDIKLHFRENRVYYFSFLACVCLGIIIGIIIISSNESYLSLLTSKNKLLYSYINGTASIGELGHNQFLKFLLPLVLIFVLGLNYYSSLISFLFITYQSAIFVMSSAAVISLYGLSGVLNFLVIMLPVNIIYFALLAFFITCVADRARLAMKYHAFDFGFNSSYFIKILVAIILLVLLCVLACLIYPLFIKSAIFIIF